MERLPIKNALLAASAALTTATNAVEETEHALDAATDYERQRLEPTLDKLRSAETMARIATRDLHSLYMNVGNKPPIPRP